MKHFDLIFEELVVARRSQPGFLYTCPQSGGVVAEERGCLLEEVNKLKEWLKEVRVLL